MEELKLVEKMINDAKECIKKNDPVQASEKIYKSVEECIKLLASQNGLPEYEEAKKEGRWWTKLLSRASITLTQKLNENKIRETWNTAYNLHVWGFHERILNIEEVEYHLPYAEWLLNYTKSKIYV